MSAITLVILSYRAPTAPVRLLKKTFIVFVTVDVHAAVCGAAPIHKTS